MIRRVVLTVFALALATSAFAQTPAPAQPPRPAMTLTTPAVQGHILGKAVYVGLFRRPQ